ncbi:metallophosphoesterase [Mucilaginibacter sp. dw_454]|uniref:metallophosphoesterase n=1 Tax=Mucilaginibacter sp. dw_454 TaxID=2720079 RepID=UPI001BD25F12|nr:metallophosphoesterase [Mucilaginibacter sp. dw_454]
MRKFLQGLLTKPVITLANKWSSRPDKKRVDAALSALYQNIMQNPGKRGRIVEFDAAKDKFIILSDQHKGARDGSDIFAKAANNYLAALNYYNKEKFFYINLGDSEELWENIFFTVKKHNKKTFEAEQRFLDRDAFIKIFGNHDLYWDNDPLAMVSLAQIYDQQTKVYEGAVLQTTIGKSKLAIYLTHGHQGDLQSDGNWFSKWFVSDIWAPFQSYLHINPNTPSNNDTLKTEHNKMMYEWSAKHKNIILITGHTHQPVFRSLTELEVLYEKQKAAQGKEADELQAQIDKLHLKTSRPPDFKGYLDTYFNSGCCCFDDGDITGIEIAEERIRLIKWAYHGKKSVRRVLEEACLKDLKLH